MKIWGSHQKDAEQGQRMGETSDPRFGLTMYGSVAKPILVIG